MMPFFLILTFCENYCIMKQNILLILMVIFGFSSSMSQTDQLLNKTELMDDSTEMTKEDQLVVVWTSGDREVALKMVFMYTYNAKKNEWWKDITLLVWGPSAKLLSEDKELQEYVKSMKEEGIHLLACKGCADQYGVSEKLEEIGVEVRYTGVDLTNFIKERHVVTF